MANSDTDFDPIDHPPSLSRPDPQQILTHTRVLVIDDDAEMLRMLQDSLLPAGFEVMSATSGSEGAQMFRAERIDVVVLDLFMPGKDGIETLSEIRRCSPKAKVLAISGGGGLGFTNALSCAKKLGASAVLAKPFTPRELLTTVLKLLAIVRS